MVDANMGYTVREATRAARALARPDIDAEWLEEPTAPEDLAAYRFLRQCSPGVAIAGGENLHTLDEFAAAMQAGALDVPQPDASNVGGITGWLKVAALAQAHHLEVSSHGMQELHVSLVSAVPNGGWLELHAFPIEDYTVGGRVRVRAEDGRALPPLDAAGTGVEFDWAKLAPYRVGAPPARL